MSETAEAPVFTLDASQQSLWDQVLERIADGESLVQICNCAGMPCARIVRTWCVKNAALDAEYARARSIGCEAIAERLRSTARGDKIDGESSGEIDRDKLIVDTDLRMLRAWKPSVYGEKATGGNAMMLNLGVQINNGGLSEEERAALMAKKQASLARRRVAEAERLAELGEGPKADA